MQALLKEFRDFILKGNMLEIAVGLIIAASFGTVVKSLVDNIIMPPIGVVMGGVDFSEKKSLLKAEQTIPATATTPEKKIPAVYLNYGKFINDVISLIVVGFCVFMVIKAYNTAKKRFEKKKEIEEAAAPAPSNEEKLLMEIRDLLAKK